MSLPEEAESWEMMMRAATARAASTAGVNGGSGTGMNGDFGSVGDKLADLGLGDGGGNSINLNVAGRSGGDAQQIFLAATACKRGGACSGVRC